MNELIEMFDRRYIPLTSILLSMTVCFHSKEHRNTLIGFVLPRVRLVREPTLSLSASQITGETDTGKFTTQPKSSFVFDY